ncbi:unnamed protein product, partial [Rotaria sordida]
GTIIPMASPGTNHCGAYLAGWSNGTLPSIIGTIVSGDIAGEYKLIVKQI